MRRRGVPLLAGFLALALTPAAAPAAGPRIVDLGASFHPIAVNSASVVAGNDYDADRAVRWKDGSVQVLAPLTSPVAYVSSSASDINADGTIVGRSATFSGFPSKIRATVWPLMGGPSGIAPAVDDPDVPYSEAHAINSSGLVAGGSAHCTGMTCSFPQAATGTAGGTFSLLPPDPGGTGSSDATDVNDAGVVVGTYGVGSVWVGGVQTLLGDFRPIGINASNVMVGGKGSSATPYVRAADGTQTALGPGGYVRGINDAGDIVGHENSPFDGWVIHQDETYYVDDLLPAGTTDWDIVSAVAVAPNGDIVGEATHEGTNVGYLLTPDYPGFRVYGSVTSTDGVPIPGVEMRVNGPKTVTVTTDAAGEYSIDLPTGDYVLSSLDSSVRPKPEPPQPGCNTDVCTFHIETQDVRRDFQKGCARTLTMGGSFAAVNGCFTATSGTTYETTEPFRVNGLDVVPAGKVTFDTLRAGMAGGPIGLKLGADSVFASQTVDWNFSAGTLTFAAPAFGTRIRGLPISGTGSISTTAGSSTMTLGVEVPKDVARATFSTFTGWSASREDLGGSFGATMTATATNDAGLKTLGFVLSPADVLKIPVQPKAPDDPATPRAAITIKSVSGTYDLKDDRWTLGGLMSVPLGKSAPVDVAGSLAFNGGWLPIRVTANVSGINKPIEPPGIFLQRLTFDLGLTGIGKLDPFTWAAGIGISLGPKSKSPETVNLGGIPIPIVPNEIASLDGTLTLQDVDRNPLTVEDTSYAGDGVLRFWDQQVATVGTTWFIGLGSVEFRGTVGFEDPTGGIFVVRGSAKGWWDADAQTASLEGHGTVHIRDVIENDLDYVITTEAIAACAGDKSGTYGIVYEWKTHRERIGGCDLDKYRRAPLAPKVRAAAAASVTRFRLAAGQGITALEVKGAPFTLTGPGVNIRADGKKGSSPGKVRVLPVPGEKVTYVILLSPKPGSYTLSGATSVRYATRLPEPSVAGTLGGDGCRPRLSWRARRIDGQVVRIVDAAPNGHDVLATSKKVSGRVSTRGTGAAVRTLQAQVLQGGGLRATLTLARYMPVLAADGRPIATGNIRRSGGRRVVWDPVCGATGYLVQVGRAKATKVKGASLSRRVPRGARISVTALGRGGAKGPAVRTRLG